MKTQTDIEIEKAAQGFKEIAHDVAEATHEAVIEGALAAEAIEGFVADVTGTSGHERVSLETAKERAALKSRELPHPENSASEAKPAVAHE